MLMHVVALLGRNVGHDPYWLIEGIPMFPYVQGFPLTLAAITVMEKHFISILEWKRKAKSTHTLNFEKKINGSMLYPG